MAQRAMTDELCQETADLYRKHGRITLAAAEAGVHRATFDSRLKVAGARGFLGPAKTLPGFEIKSIATKEGDSWVRQTREPGEEFAVPDGHVVKGVSALLDADGRTVQQWVKTREGNAPDPLRSDQGGAERICTGSIGSATSLHQRRAAHSLPDCRSAPRHVLMGQGNRRRLRSEDRGRTAALQHEQPRGSVGQFERLPWCWIWGLFPCG
jgi:hypothetical protein